MKTLRSWTLLLFTLCAFAIIAAEPDAGPPGSVNNVMVTAVTPATNTIWGVEDPQTDEEWQVLIDAAAQLIDAANQIKAGGTGPNDSTWAEAPAWQQFAGVLVESGMEIQAAARDRNLDQVIEVANDKMYPPCEECHLQFHPGMQQ